MPAYVAMLLGLLSAALVPAVVVAALTLANVSGAGLALALALAYGFVGFFVAGAHVVVLGLPLALLGAKLKRISVPTALLLGFAVGAGPTAVAYWPPFPSLGLLVGRRANVEGWHDVPLRIAGVLTPAAWTDWAQQALQSGLFGAAGGLGFALVWRRRR